MDDVNWPPPGVCEDCGEVYAYCECDEECDHCECYWDWDDHSCCYCGEY